MVPAKELPLAHGVSKRTFDGIVRIDFVLEAGEDGIVVGFLFFFCFEAFLYFAPAFFERGHGDYGQYLESLRMVRRSAICVTVCWAYCEIVFGNSQGR